MTRNVRIIRCNPPNKNMIVFRVMTDHLKIIFVIGFSPINVFLFV